MYDEAVERVKNFANSMKVDVATKEGDHIGPVVSKTQFDKIQSLIQVGIDEGAKLVAGGTGKPDGLDRGAGTVKFFGQILPDAKKVTYKLDITRLIQRKLVMGIADGSVEVDGREIYTAKDLKVGLFENTENF